MRTVVGVGLAQRIRLVTGVQWEDWAPVMEKSQHLFSRAFPWVLIHSCVCPAGAQLQFPDC